MGKQEPETPPSGHGQSRWPLRISGEGPHTPGAAESRTGGHKTWVPSWSLKIVTEQGLAAGHT